MRTMMVLPRQEPFLVWTAQDSFSAPSETIRCSCAGHLQDTMQVLESVVGKPMIEGIVVYDSLQGGFGIAKLLNEEGRSLHHLEPGALCDGEFDEGQLCAAMNGMRAVAMMHEGSRGMLITLAQNQSRRLLLLHQSEAMYINPAGRGNETHLGARAVGLLAHELGHARDYAQGRPARPSLEEIAQHCKPGHAQSISVVADMALAEYVATRAECQGQEHMFGASSWEVAMRAAKMARGDIGPIDLGKAPQAHEGGEEQWRANMQHVGYMVGTLAAYVDAKSPIMDTKGQLRDAKTDDEVLSNMKRSSPLAQMVKAVRPAIERVALMPDAANRARFVSVLERSLVAVSTNDREAAAKRVSASVR